MNKKITIVISSFIVIAVLAVAAFWVVWERGDNGGENVNQVVNKNQTDNGEIDTSDWLTYRNEEYGYSIKYPKEWVLREYPDTKTGADFTGDNCKIIVAIGGSMAEEYLDMPFDEYIKIAGLGAENYESLHSSMPVFTDSGIKGYVTTWDVESRIGESMYVSGEWVFFEEKKIGRFKSRAIEIRYGVQEPDKNCFNIRNAMIKTFNYID